MKYFPIIVLLCANLFASLDTITSFDANFIQSITDEKNKTLHYKGHIVALKPENAKWSYTKPVAKEVYINKFEVTVVEPEIEQVIIKKIESNFDFFQIIANAEKIDADKYKANYKNSEFIITLQKGLIESISYLDQFENRVTIVFEKQKQNEPIDKTLFIPNYSLNFDIIKD